jgi:xylan 1,4-beta-xylosidase
MINRFGFLALATALVCVAATGEVRAQDPRPESHRTFVNPIIPGDHPDPTLTQIGNYFYTSGSSFNPTPRIYRSTNLVHWEAIAQPVTSDWSVYGSNPGGGVWGGHTVYHHGQYWHFFGRGGGNMYFVTADDPAGPWSFPQVMMRPSGMGGLGVDNSIFIDEDSGRWFLLTKAGRGNNHIVELGEDGQPNGTVLDLTWLNPESEGFPYVWAEGPVMWKHGDYYYYSFAEHLVGLQYVMRSQTLTDDREAWEIMPGSIFRGTRGFFDRPNHTSPVVHLADGTSWAVSHSYFQGTAWQAHGRQGLLHQIHYDANHWPYSYFPSNFAEEAPNLPSSGVPWMVPKSDMFNGTSLHPEWSLLGQTPSNTFSLTTRPGWLYLQPRRGSNTVIKNDGEHQYSLITRVESNPQAATDEAGLWIINGPETLRAKVFASINDVGDPVVSFSFDATRFDMPNDFGNPVWLKLRRDEHVLSGYFSADGHSWTQIGEPITAAVLGREVTQFNDFTGNQQGLYIQGRAAYFDLYIYRDAYTDIAARYPVNRYGARRVGTYLGDITNGTWALYAGVEFGGEVGRDDRITYPKRVRGVSVEAASAGEGGTIEVWLDSLGTGRKIAEIEVDGTESWTTYETFSAEITEDVFGRHDLYLKFVGSGEGNLFRLQTIRFEAVAIGTSIEVPGRESVSRFSLEQNHPNPFGTATTLRFTLAESGPVTIRVFDIVGREVARILDDRFLTEGPHQFGFDASGLPSGVYIYRMETADTFFSRMMTIVR